MSRWESLMGISAKDKKEHRRRRQAEARAAASAQCRQDIRDHAVEDFAQNVRIIDKATGLARPFTLSSEQQMIVDALSHHPEARVVVLKARQVGSSTVGRLFFFREAFVSDAPHTFVCVAHIKRVAQELMRHDAGWLSDLAKKHELLDRDLDRNSVTATTFMDTGASLISSTAGNADGIRGLVFRGAHLSEFAYYGDPVGVLMGLNGLKGRLLIESTPNRPYDKFHELCMSAKPWDPADPPDPGQWALVTMWWYQSPAHRLTPGAGFQRTPDEEELARTYNLDDEQLAWRRSKIAEFNEQGQPGLVKFRIDFPGCMDDCFLSRTGSWYTPDEIATLVPVHVSKEDVLCVLEEPVALEGYVMGVDVSAGVGQDYSTIVVYSVVLRTIVATYRTCHTKPKDFSRTVLMVATKYNNAFVLIESNSYGSSVIEEIKESGYYNLWTKNREPWVTTKQTKNEAHAALRAMISARTLTTVCLSLYKEIAALSVPEGAVNPEAPAGMHDDLAMAAALGAIAVRDAPPSLRTTRLSPEKVVQRVAAIQASRTTTGNNPNGMRGAT